MPLLNPQDERDFYETLDLSGYQRAPTFTESFSAGFDYAIDEGLSVSSLLNRQGYEDRNQQLFDMANDGFDLQPYTDDGGSINYDRIASDTGLIKSDGELYDERNEILRKRREVNDDVLARGNGIGQFLGSMTGYMLDPVNIATLPIGLGTAYKGMSVLSNALMTSRNAAAIGVAGELAIQPLVYQHKHDINSPYEFADAAIAVAGVAAGSALIGGAVGGLSGYFRRVIEKSQEFVSLKPMSQAVNDIDEKLVVAMTADDVDVEAIAKLTAEKQRLEQAVAIEAKYKPSPEDEALNVIDRMYQQITAQKAKEAGFSDDMQANAAPRVEDITLQAYDDFQLGVKGEYANLLDVQSASIKALDDERTKILKENPTWISIIAKEGGLNKDRWLREGIDPKDMQSKELKQVFGSPLFRKSGGRDPDMLAERLREAGFSNDMQANDAIDFVMDLMRFSPRKLASAEAEIQAKQLQDQIDELQALSETAALERYYRGAINTNIQKDIDMLVANYKFEQRMNAPTKEYDDYVVERDPPAPKATRTVMQREQLDSEGLAKDYDRDIANYEALEVKKVVIDGKLVDADDAMKALDDQIEGVESVRVCAIG